jgi:hypothetical protein
MKKCGCCNHWQIPTFDMRFLHLPGYAGDGKLEDLDADHGIDLDDSYFICEQCSERLDLRDPTLREWVAERPTRDARGYRIRPTSSYKLDPPYIIRQLLKMKRLDQLKGWYNTVLGETYNDGNSKLEPDKVKALMTNAGRGEIGSTVPCALASDMGRTCHLTLGPIQGDHVVPMLFETVPSDHIEARIKELRQQYNIVTGSVDRHPYTPTAEQIRNDSNGIILPVEYRGDAHLNLKLDEYGALDYVQINRTKAIDDVVKAVLRRAWTMSGYGQHANVLVEHMCDMVRIEMPEKLATWEKTTGQDHFMHSLVLLQASPKIRHLVQVQLAVDPPKKLLGMIGVPSITAQKRRIGDPHKVLERLL